MLLITIVKIAIRNLLSNKLRSFLAILGVVIGVFSVSVMLAIASGAQKQVIENISSMGVNLLTIFPGQRGIGMVRTSSSQNLTLNDARELLMSVDEIDAVAPVVRGNEQIKYYNRNYRATLIGTTPTYFSIRSIKVEYGQVFTDRDVTGRSRVIVLGPALVKELFDVPNPTGEVVKVKGINFTIVGVLKEKGSAGWDNSDEQAFIPYSTAMKQVFGLDYLHQINVSVQDKVDIEAVKAKITNIIRKQHHLKENEEDDFRIFSQTEIIEEVSKVTSIFAIVLGGIGSISLLVGGIGVMNIMLVIVTERTREIGIRKAIGAKNRDILMQFVVESTVMSGTGGIIGVIASLIAIKILGTIPNIPVAIHLPYILLAFSFSVAVGVFFGFYPARQAARLNPAEALRYE